MNARSNIDANGQSISDYRNIFVNSNKDYYRSVIYGKNKESNCNEEYTFDEGVIVSSTDIRGIITYANRKFCEISGYTKEELVGSNHNIIRHPDMPKAIYRQIWNFLSEGLEWSGVIKNLRKDGRYYWVHSHIIPVISNERIIGYSAARKPPMQREINEAKELYKTMLETETNEYLI